MYYYYGGHDESPDDYALPTLAPRGHYNQVERKIFNEDGSPAVKKFASLDTGCTSEFEHLTFPLGCSGSVRRYYNNPLKDFYVSKPSTQYYEESFHY